MHTTAPLQKEAPKRTAVTTGKATTNPLQRKAVGEDEDALQMKQSPVQLQDDLDDEDEPLQMKAAPVQLEDGLDDNDKEPLQMKKNPLQRKPYSNNPLQRKATEATTPQPKKENKTGLPDNLKEGVENLSGYSMDDVKVHYNSDKPAQLQALAYAQGTDIHVAPGQEQHLPHEAWHVVQQKQGRVQPTIQMKEGVAVNDDKGLEGEADRMGGKIISNTTNTFQTRQPVHNFNSLRQPIQPMLKFLGNILKQAPKPLFPRLEIGSGKLPLSPLPIYKLEHRFSGYDISGSFNAEKDMYSSVTINYIEKTESSQGFKKLLQDIELSAIEIGSTGATVTFDQCKPEVVDKLKKYAKELNWDFNILDEGNGATGPTLFLDKPVTPQVDNNL